MTLPHFVTETNEAPPWTDCTIAAGLMATNKMLGNKYPATLGEREALRRATGDSVGGVGISALNVGLERRYGAHLPAPKGQHWGDVKAYLRDKGGALIQGNYRLLGAPYTRWDRKFAMRRLAAHAMYADHYRITHDDVYVMDPLGRGIDSRTGKRYIGEYIPTARVRAFMEGLTHSDGSLYVAYAPEPSVPHVVEPPIKEESVKFVSTNGYGATSIFRLDVKAGTPVYYFNDERMTTVAKDATVEVFGSADAHTGNWVVEVATGGPYFDQEPRPTLGIIKGGTPYLKA